MDENALNPSAERCPGPEVANPAQPPCIRWNHEWRAVEHGKATELCCLLTTHHRATKVRAILENARLGKVRVQNVVTLATASNLLKQTLVLLEYALTETVPSSSDCAAKNPLGEAAQTAPGGCTDSVL